MNATQAILVDLRKLPQFKSLKPRQKRFISAYIQYNCKVRPAAQHVGIEEKTHYNWIEKDNYKQAIEYAREIFANTLEADMFNRSLEGYEKPIAYKGKVTAYYREFNIEERKFILKGLKPQYRDNFVVQNVAAPIQVNIVHYDKGGNNGGSTTNDDSGK